MYAMIHFSAIPCTFLHEAKIYFHFTLAKTVVTLFNGLKIMLSFSHPNTDSIFQMTQTVLKQEIFTIPFYTFAVSPLEFGLDVTLEFQHTKENL